MTVIALLLNRGERLVKEVQRTADLCLQFQHTCVQKEKLGVPGGNHVLKYGCGWACVGVIGFLGGKDFVGLIGHIFSALKAKGTWYLNYTVYGLL